MWFGWMDNNEDSGGMGPFHLPRAIERVREELQEVRQRNKKEFLLFHVELDNESILFLGEHWLPQITHVNFYFCSWTANSNAMMMMMMDEDEDDDEGDDFRQHRHQQQEETSFPLFLEFLSQPAHLASWKSLALIGCDLDGEERIEALLSHVAHFQTLEELSFSTQQLTGPRSGQLLCDFLGATPCGTHLRELALHGTCLDLDSVRGLAQGLRARGCLQELNLGQCNLTDESLLVLEREALSPASINTTTATTTSSFVMGGTPRAANIPPPCLLTKLVVADNHLTHASLPTVTRILRHVPQLRHLDLSFTTSLFRLPLEADEALLSNFYHAVQHAATLERLKIRSSPAHRHQVPESVVIGILKSVAQQQFGPTAARRQPQQPPPQRQHQPAAPTTTTTTTTTTLFHHQHYQPIPAAPRHSLVQQQPQSTPSIDHQQHQAKQQLVDPSTVGLQVLDLTFNHCSSFVWMALIHYLPRMQYLRELHMSDDDDGSYDSSVLDKVIDSLQRNASLETFTILQEADHMNSRLVEGFQIRVQSLLQRTRVLRRIRHVLHAPASERRYPRPAPRALWSHVLARLDGSVGSRAVAFEILQSCLVGSTGAP